MYTVGLSRAKNKSPLVPASRDGGVSTVTHPVPNHFIPLPSADDDEDDELPMGPLQSAQESLHETYNMKVVNCICATSTSSAALIQCCLCGDWSHLTCYSIDSGIEMEKLKDLCCMHCKPSVYKELTNGKQRPLPPIKQLPCGCNNCESSYPIPYRQVECDINYDDTNWVQCFNGACGRVMHAKCYRPYDKKDGYVFSTECQEDEDSEDE